MNDDDLRRMAANRTLYRLSGPARTRVSRRAISLILFGVAVIGLTVLWYIW